MFATFSFVIATLPGVVTGCLVKETLKAGSSLRGDGYILLRMKKPAPQQNKTPIISSTLSAKTRAISELSLTQHHRHTQAGPGGPEDILASSLTNLFITWWKYRRSLDNKHSNLWICGWKRQKFFLPRSQNHIAVRFVLICWSIFQRLWPENKQL